MDRYQKLMSPGSKLLLASLPSVIVYLPDIKHTCPARDFTSIRELISIIIRVIFSVSVSIHLVSRRLSLSICSPL